MFIVERDENYGHFLGCIVLSKEKKSNSYEIIDGQQRLITLSILLSCIAFEFNKIGDKNISNSIINNYLKGNDFGKDYFKIERKEGDFFLSSIIQASLTTIENIKEQFERECSSNDKYNKKILDCFLFYLLKIENLIRENKNYL